MQRIAIALALAFSAACGGSSTPPASPGGGSAPPSEPGSGATGGCIKSGCSGTVCVEPGKEVVTTCEYKAEYACYTKATCEKQPNGECGWTQTAELTACLANPPPM